MKQDLEKVKASKETEQNVQITAKRCKIIKPYKVSAEREKEKIFKLLT